MIMMMMILMLVLMLIVMLLLFLMELQSRKMVIGRWEEHVFFVTGSGRG